MHVIHQPSGRVVYLLANLSFPASATTREPPLEEQSEKQTRHDTEGENEAQGQVEQGKAEEFEWNEGGVALGEEGDRAKS